VEWTLITVAIAGLIVTRARNGAPSAAVPAPGSRNNPTNPDHAAIHLRRALHLQASGFQGAAMAAFNTALSLDPHMPEVYLGRGLLLRDRQDYHPAIDDLQQALVLKPDLAEAYLARATCYELIGLTNEAILSYTEALAFKPDLVHAYLGRARMGNFDTFKRDWQAARSLGWEPSDKEIKLFRRKFHIGDDLWSDIMFPLHGGN
jgi:tetratricopeptide (TPR) repeat protein